MDIPVRALKNQFGPGRRGAGTISHAYIQRLPLRCSALGSSGLYFDDGNKLLLSTTTNQVFSWRTNTCDRLNESPRCDAINEGPVLCIRYSLDAEIIAIQRSSHVVEFRNRETGEISTIKCKVGSESILGFFWTDCPSCDIVCVKTSGLDLFTYDPKLKSPKLVETKHLSINWYTYTHESRLVLLASGMQCKSFTGFQFSSAGIVRLPKFEMSVAKAEVNNKPVLSADDVHILTVYGRIYCLQVDVIGMVVHLYRFYRDAVVQQGSLPIYSTQVAVSVVDNVLLVHQIDAKVVILYDILFGFHAPLSAPLPLLLRSGYNMDASFSESMNIETNGVSNHEAVVYGEGWIYLVPDLICDAIHGALWRIHLDLEAIAASISEVPFILEFLQRRRLESRKAKQLSMGIMQTIILERRPISMVSKAINVLVSSYSQLAKARKSLPKRPNIFCSDASRRVLSVPNSKTETCGSSVQQECTNRTDNNFLSFSENSSDSDENSSIKFLENSGYHPHPKQGRERETNFGFSEGRIVATASQPSTTPPASALGSDASDVPVSDPINVAVSADEMYNFIFATVEEEMTRDSSYLVAVIVEYFRCAAVEKLNVHRNLHVMIVQLLSHDSRYSELGLFITNKILEPSKEVALQLLECGRQDVQTKKLALDMLRQLGLHLDYILALVQDGYYLEALRYAQKNKVRTIRPSVFLDAAVSSRKPLHLAAVLRSLSDSIPGFGMSSEYAVYHQILNGMH